jgi:hypothetical protein
MVVASKDLIPRKRLFLQSCNPIAANLLTKNISKCISRPILDSFSRMCSGGTELN